MDKKKKNETAPYVKYPLALSYLFNPVESRFILHMIEAEFLKKQGYDTGWTRAGYAKRMGLKECAFERCVKRMVDMELLAVRHNKLGNRVFFSFNMALYEKLVSILSATCHVDSLIDFCDTKFKKEARSIESITEQEIETLRSNNGLRKLHPSMRIE
jgi:hypothetical protein